MATIGATHSSIPLPQRKRHWIRRQLIVDGPFQYRMLLPVLVFTAIQVVLLMTALLFASFHVQYFLSPATLLLFVFGLMFGVVRQRTSLTIVILVHFLYNFSAGLTLYWTVQNLLTIAQTKLTRTTSAKPAAATAPVLTSPIKKRK